MVRKNYETRQIERMEKLGISKPLAKGLLEEEVLSGARTKCNKVMDLIFRTGTPIERGIKKSNQLKLAGTEAYNEIEMYILAYQESKEQEQEAMKHIPIGVDLD